MKTDLYGVFNLSAELRSSLTGFPAGSRLGPTVEGDFEKYFAYL